MRRFALVFTVAAAGAMLACNDHSSKATNDLAQADALAGSNDLARPTNDLLPTRNDLGVGDLSTSTDDLAGADLASADLATQDLIGADLTALDMVVPSTTYHVQFYETDDLDDHKITSPTLDPLAIQSISLGPDFNAFDRVRFCIEDSAGTRITTPPALTIDLPDGWALENVDDQSSCSFIDATGCTTEAAGCFGFTLRAGYAIGTFSATISAPNTTSGTFHVSATAPGDPTWVLPLINSAQNQGSSNLTTIDDPPSTGPLPKPALAAASIAPTALAADGAGGFYFADPPQHEIFYVSASGEMSSVVLINATANNVSLAWDNVHSRLYWFEDATHTISFITPATASSATVIAGGGNMTGDNVAATTADLTNTTHISVDSTGAIFLDDATRIRTIAAPTATTPMITTVLAASGACSAALSFVGCSGSGCAMVSDGAGTLYVIGEFCGTDNGSSSSIYSLVSVEGSALTWLAGHAGTTNIYDTISSKGVVLIGSPTGIALHDDVIYFGDGINATVRTAKLDDSPDRVTFYAVKATGAGPAYDAAPTEIALKANDLAMRSDGHLILSDAADSTIVLIWE